MSLQQLSIQELKQHYESLFREKCGDDSAEAFKNYLRAVVAELAWNLDVDLNLLEKDYDDEVICKTRAFGALDSLRRVLLAIAEAANYKATTHPDWSLLAGRIEIQRLKLQVPDTFQEMLNLNQKVWRKDKDHDYYDFANRHAKELESMIVPERDYDLYFFGVRTLEKSYLMRLLNGGSTIIETPQRMYLRIAAFLWMPDLDMVKKYYDLMSQGYFTHASPTMFHSGIAKGSLASCFLLTMQDDLEKIFKCLGQCAMISKSAGGIGLDITNIRHSKVGHLGQSSGIIPMLKVYDAGMRYVDQAGRRKGSATIFLQPWHIDFPDFLLLKRQHGKEERRARDLFYSVWNCDLFMDRVREDKDWTLFCPKYAPMLKDTFGEEFEKWYKHYEQELPKQEGHEHFMRVVPARQLWDELLKTQKETGMPFMTNKDTANYTSNQKNLGVIRSSNLCVSGDTYILTKDGQHQIEDLVNETVDVWNGEEWSTVKVFCTSTKPKSLLTVTFSDGSSINCTPEHKFYIQRRYNGKAIEIEAQDLTVNDKLIKFNLPNAAEFNADTTNDLKYPYTHGFFCGDGTYGHGKPRLALYGSKKDVLNYLDIKSTSCQEDAQGRINTCLPDDIAQKFTVPLNASIENKLLWFAGYADADGTIARNGTNESLQIVSGEKEFLLQIRLMLQTLGIQAKVINHSDAHIALMPDGNSGKKEYSCKAAWRILIDSNGLYKLHQLGLQFNRLQYTPRLPQRSASQFVKVVSVDDNNIVTPTFCFTEPKRHMGVFNGLLTGQCQEIMEVTDEHTISSCNLASIALDEYVNNNTYNFEALGQVVRLIVRGLNRVIDRTYYPLQEHNEHEITGDGPIKSTNLRYRPLGLGVQALADAFLKMDLAWTDSEAKELNRDIFATIYYYAVDESVELAKEEGVYDGFYGSPASEGLLKPDLLAIERARKQLRKEGVTSTHPDYERRLPILASKFLEDGLSPLYDWDALRAKVKKYGLRNSLLVALMPTASSAQIRYKNESFEPFTTNMYVRTVLSGNHLIVNRYMVKDLQALGLWNKSIINFIIKNEGSIQGLPEGLVPEEKLPVLQRIKEKCLTAFELSQKLMVDMSIDRAYYVCQSQSLNIHSKDPSNRQLTSLHFYAWDNALATGMYYLRTKPATEAIQFTVEGELDVKKTVVCTDEVCISCQS